MPPRVILKWVYATIIGWSLLYPVCVSNCERDHASWSSAFTLRNSYGWQCSLKVSNSNIWSIRTHHLPCKLEHKSKSTHSNWVWNFNKMNPGCSHEYRKRKPSNSRPQAQNALRKSHRWRQPDGYCCNKQFARVLLLQKCVLTVISNENGKSTPIPAHRSKHFLTATETGKYNYDKYRIHNIQSYASLALQRQMVSLWDCRENSTQALWR